MREIKCGGSHWRRELNIFMLKDEFELTGLTFSYDKILSSVCQHVHSRIGNHIHIYIYFRINISNCDVINPLPRMFEDLKIMQLGFSASFYSTKMGYEKILFKCHSNGKVLGKVFQKEGESRNEGAFPGSCVPFKQEPFYQQHNSRFIKNIVISKNGPLFCSFLSNLPNMFKILILVITLLTLLFHYYILKQASLSGRLTTLEQKRSFRPQPGPVRP